MAQAQRREEGMDAVMAAAAGVREATPIFKFIAAAGDLLRKRNAANAEKRAQQSQAEVLAREAMLDDLLTPNPTSSTREPRVMVPFLSAIVNPQVEAPVMDHNLFERAAKAANDREYFIGEAKVRLGKKHQVSVGNIIDALSAYNLTHRGELLERASQQRIESAKAVGENPNIVDITTQKVDMPIMDGAEEKVRSIEANFLVGASLPKRERLAIHTMLVAAMLRETRGKSKWESTVEENSRRVTDYLSAHGNEPVLKAVVRGLLDDFTVLNNSKDVYNAGQHPTRRSVEREFTSRELEAFGEVNRAANDLRTAFDDTVRGHTELREKVDKARADGTLDRSGVTITVNKEETWTVRESVFTQDNQKLKAFTLIRNRLGLRSGKRSVENMVYVVEQDVFILQMPGESSESRRAEDGKRVRASFARTTYHANQEGRPSGLYGESEQAGDIVTALLEGGELLDQFVGELTDPKTHLSYPLPL